MIEHKLFDKDSLEKENAGLGNVVVFQCKGRYIFSHVVKVKQDDKVFPNKISGSIVALRNGMESLNVKIIKILSKGNVFDQPSWTSMEQVIRKHFLNSGLHTMVCTGEIIVRPLENREAMVREFHESVVGGHKEIFKTYWRLRRLRIGT